tara:strand:+ start:5958 stop:6446 length:489 start_codon:yes stop_codon:yes gene_type:complete
MGLPVFFPLSFLLLVDSIIFIIIMARKRKLTEKLAQKILDYFADGYTIREVFLKDDIDITWSNFRNYLIADDNLMLRYQKSKELAVDLKLSELEDKRKILEEKIERGDLDGKAGQNLVNLYKIITASAQWNATKLSPKRYSKQAELTIKGDDKQPLNITWAK